MEKPLFTGVCTALVTPFLNDKINHRMYDLLLERQIRAGVKAVVIAGTTGESPTLTDLEKITLFQRAKTVAKERCLVIAGTGSNSTTHSIQLSIAAEAAGADAILIVSPYYNKATADGIYQHYRSIAQNVSIPIIVYNVPSRTGLDIPVCVYEKLASIPNIVGVKEANSDVTKIARIRNACGDQFTVWTGNDDQIVPSMSLGAKGVISVLSNVMPQETVELCTAAQNNDFLYAGVLQREFIPLIDVLFSEVNPIPVKAAMKLIGFDCGSCRLPLCDITTPNYDNLKTLLQ